MGKGIILILILLIMFGIHAFNQYASKTFENSQNTIFVSKRQNLTVGSAFNILTFYQPRHSYQAR